MYIIVMYTSIITWIKIYLYTRNTRPGAQKLFLLAKSEGIQTTLKDNQEFISGRTEEQQLKESTHTKQCKHNNGHKVSSSLLIDYN